MVRNDLVVAAGDHSAQIPVLETMNTKVVTSVIKSPFSPPQLFL